MNTLIHSSTGLFHLLFSMASLITGTVVLVSAKGTRIHKVVGYLYTLCMVGVNATAFGLYDLFGKPGPFHLAALISLATLLAGIFPALLRIQNWLRLHVAFMYYSVIGLYAAFVSELIVRIPRAPFGPAVGLATAVVMMTAVLAFRSLGPRWLKQVNTSFTKH